ncbi:MAG: UDP-2,3-diacylglucosamine diphosphatase [Bacteroidales bacterium]|nr:UDP-2,3-diacylglucosamine diphosphatase [Bacteroidales bacterium]
MTNKSHKKVYFFSDCHLGIPDVESSRKRETLLVNWLNEIKEDALEIYIMGDLFDFWFEYKTAVPKGFTRLFGKLAELTDSGIPIHFYRGNHDIWSFSYFEEELNIQMHREPEKKEILGKTFYLAHGDGLGRGDKGYKFIKWVFERKINQWLFRWIHPDIGLALGLFFSRKSRYANETKESKLKNEPNKQSIEDSRLPVFAKNLLNKGAKIDYFVMGHWHIMRDLKLNDQSHFIFLGDWITHFSYGVFDGKTFEIKKYNQE